ncbi:MAG: class B sortase [Bacilli bacterium]|nr:class B sortase [Bacilli bacterium]
MKKSKKKTLLSIFFILVIIISLGTLIFEITKAPKENILYEDAPEEIIVPEEEKEVVEIDDREYVKMSPDVNLNEKRKNHNNNDIVGRLEIPDLFNILVVKGKDNQFYLNNSINKKEDVRGSEFMDYRVNSTSKQINIYGHNTRDANIKVPFLKLESFLKKDFFDSHPYIIFQHDNGKSVYKILSIKEITTDYEHMEVTKTGPDFVKHVDKLKSKSIYTREVPYDETSEIIVLQTCSHHLENAFYIITAVKIEYKTEQ